MPWRFSDAGICSASPATPCRASEKPAQKRKFGSRGFKGDYSVENELKDALLRTEVRFSVGPECVGLHLADVILQGAPHLSEIREYRS